MRIALITANCGSSECAQNYVEQVVPVGTTIDVIYLNDKNYPLRASMTPRMQAKIPKILGWQIYPKYDIYIWKDASFSVDRKDAVIWLLDKLNVNDIVFFQHPQRFTPKEECDFLEMELAKGNEYITSRYTNEQYNTHWFDHSNLYAAGIFAYKNDYNVFETMRQWFMQVMTYHVNDQLSLPHCLSESYCIVGTIRDQNILHNEYFVHHNHK